MSEITTLVFYIDADACPVKDEVLRVAGRMQAKTFFVSNSWMRLPDDPLVERVVVPAGPNVADDWIAERAGAGAVVVTADVPLADRCVKTGARVVAPSGRVFDAGSIGMALATRDLMEDLRSAGMSTSGPAPFGPKQRQAFLQALDREARRAMRDLASPGSGPGPRR
ncbi:MAG: YaiI/YqxD family protein [Hyphomicrobiales bacterium]|nr:YaiI/YqxD family protein [Hyphomicrobiales bacterium]